MDLPQSSQVGLALMGGKLGRAVEVGEQGMRFCLAQVGRVYTVLFLV